VSAAATEAPASGEALEERYRLAVLVASGPLVLLLGPVVLPLFDDRSFLASTRGEVAPLAILFGIFFWPLFVGVLGLRRTLARRAPGTAAFAVPAVVHLLAAIGGALLLLAVLGDKQRARESSGVWLSLGMALATAYVIARGFRRKGWERWAQIVAGLWLGYAAFTLVTAQAEVAFHFAQSLQEVNWQESETATFREYLADFRAGFHDIRKGSEYSTCLDPASYVASQRLAGELLNQGSVGLIYPSVRHRGGTCLACFRPALVVNVRKGWVVTLEFSNALAAPKVHIDKGKKA
jgi:hypothetical protein